MMNNPKIVKASNKGMTPNTAQKRPGAPKPSLPKKLNKRTQGR